ncbi:glutamate decarboxylase-like protein 1 [Melanomma pulvis-pyrius CBS 109.77]|uniref:Glutamate decarboxylase-like protein 1 n=1 Tax=Melanomma pulvis-pyrius CBS 109.77 TaxID=1314802 RepID=A0A6A6XPH4_9PLEO|nr:glutamate decarboxylase-like protein 1 [Melanomma pulvis-pyrius CBS 109.77]
MVSNAYTNGAAGLETPLNRADEVKDLLDAVQALIVPFVRAADSDAATKHTGRGLSGPGSHGPRTTLVDHLPPRKLETLLNLEIPAQRRGKEGLLDVVQKTLRYSVNTWDQGFMDKLYASTNAVGLVSELLLAVLNTNAHVYQVSPVLTLIEKHTTRFLANLLGFTSPFAGGISQPGGSASNSTALVIARNTLYPSTKKEGLGGRRFTLFTSAHGHYSLEKAAQIFGLGSDAVISVPVDKQGRMLPAALAALVQQSKDRGETPFFVNATAGTTVLGSFDPLHLLAPICKRHNLWLHVDGSWGGPVAFSPRYLAERLEGVDLADSVAITPHKMLGVPMTCSFLIGRDLRQFHSAMTLPAGYLFHGGEEEDDDDDNEAGDRDPEIYDLADLTPQCGRRADSLKLYLSLSYYGLAHFSSLIDAGFANAEYLLGLLVASPNFLPVSESPLPCWQVCFYYARDGKLSGDENEVSRATSRIARGLIGRGFMVDFAPGERGSFFRVVVNGGTKRGTLDGLVKAIEEAAGELGV